MPDLSDTVAKCRIGTAKNFTLLLLLYHTQIKAKGKVVFVVDGGVVCRIINTGREQTEQPCRIS